MESQETAGLPGNFVYLCVPLRPLWSKKPTTHDNMFVAWQRRTELRVARHLGCELAASPSRIICVHLR